MKANEELILKVIANSYKNSNSFQEIVALLLNFELIDEKRQTSLIDKLKEDTSLKTLLIDLIQNKSLIEYIDFYHNYYLLSDAINKALAIIREKEQIKKELVSSLVYPAILIIMTGFALLFISQYIVPQLVMLNPQTISEYSLIISILRYGPLLCFCLIISTICLFIGGLYLLKRNFTKYLTIFLKIPLLNKLIRYYTTITFTLYLKEIIKNVPLTSDSIYTLKKQTNNDFIQYVCCDIIEQLEQGYHIFKVIKENKLLQNNLKQTLYLANNSKQMSMILDDYYQLKIDLLKKKIKVFLAIFIPVIVSLIGVLLIMMYLLIMLPVLNMSASLW